MTFRNIVVLDKDGAHHQANLVMCDECEGEEFVVFEVNKHNHLQCTHCGTSYCQSGSDCGIKR